MTASRSTRRRTPARHARRVTLTSLAVTLTAAVLAAPGAQAAPGAPRLLGPSGDVQGAPEIRWSPVAGATGYEVQVDDDDAFTSLEFKASTVNRVAAPTAPLKSGTFHYRVRAKDASRAWGEWSQGEFTQTQASPPVQIAPGDGSLVRRPEDQALLSWTSVPGAASYVVEFDTETDFVGAESASTKSTSLTTPTGQKPGITYYWRVRASLASGVFGDWSSTWSYANGELPTPRITGPEDAQDVTDVALDWSPVPGASHYEVQVDDDRNFNSLEKGVPSEITSTRWSPPASFVNRQYFWRVRAVDADGNTSAWARASDDDWASFNRVWRERPELVFPVDASVPADTPQDGRRTVDIHDDMYFEWTPVERASRYRLYLSIDPNFTVNNRTTWTCDVVGTVYTPGYAGDDCLPRADGREYFWKVLPLDQPSGNGAIDGLFSEAQSFTYHSRSAQEEDFTFTSPAELNTLGEQAALGVPTISWKPRTAKSTYLVEILSASGAVVAKQTTVLPVYTPADRLKPADGPFRVRVTGSDREKSNTLTITSPGTFTVASSDPTTGRAPLTPGVVAPTPTAPDLAWEPHPDAAYYKVWIKRSSSTGWLMQGSAPIVSAEWRYPRAQSTNYDTDVATPGIYDWHVVAHNEDGVELARGQNGSYEITNLGAVTGQEIAITGTALDRGDTCVASGATTICDKVPTTPVLNWNHVEHAAFYKVFVSRDEDFTTGLVWDTEKVGLTTVNSRWTPNASTHSRPYALPDSQALSAYYWYILPCKSTELCAPSPESVQSPSVHAFRKTSPQIQLTSPRHQASPDSPTEYISSTEVNFSWTPYLTTNQAVRHTESKVASHQSARAHEIQVATEPTFSRPITSAEVDQPFYTAPSTIYPEGPLYWRVRAIDGDSNDLTWSEARTFVKRSPSPTLISPANGAKATPLTPFSWDDMPFTSTWTLQVAKNDDTNFSTTNLVLNRTGIKRSTFATGAGTKLLAAADTPYVWRVRQVFPGNVVGAWSEVRRFSVASQTPTLLEPAHGATVDGSSVVMRWMPVPTATRHKVQVRATTGTSTTSVTTAANSYAPTSALKAGTKYEWRVQALDPDSTVIGSTVWRTFTVAGGSAPGGGTTTPPRPPVVKSASKTTISKPKTVKAKKGKARATIKVTVKATAKGASRPTGTVKIYVKKKLVGSGKLNSRGAVKIKLKSLKAGKHKLTATYAGNSRTTKSTSKAVTLKIKR